MCCCVFCLQGVDSARTEEGGQGVRRDCVWGGGKLRVISLKTAFRSAGVGSRAGGRRGCRCRK